jgi:hypothetical protein
MKNSDNINLDDSNLITLNQIELMEYEGGIIPLLGLIFGGLGLGLSAAYAVGYAVGSLN